jgi:hypothetical protein
MKPTHGAKAHGPEPWTKLGSDTSCGEDGAHMESSEPVPSTSCLESSNEGCDSDSGRAHNSRRRSTCGSCTAGDMSCPDCGEHSSVSIGSHLRPMRPVERQGSAPPLVLKATIGSIARAWTLSTCHVCLCTQSDVTVVGHVMARSVSADSFLACMKASLQLETHQ